MAARSYHHGDLRQALMTAAEAVLAEKGPGGFTLRECARRAGVSPAAPAHHFGNIAGLLTAIAAHGFAGLADAMAEAAGAAQDAPAARLAAIGEAYLAFARRHPDRYRVMFGRFVLDTSDAALAAASARAFGILRDQVAAVLGRAAEDCRAEVMFAWSAVHGFASLVLERRTDLADDAAVAAGAAVVRLVTGALGAQAPPPCPAAR